MASYFKRSFIYDVIISILVITNKECFASLHYEKILHTTLLEDYNLDIRPEPAHDEPVDVHFDVRIKKLVKLDVREQVFIINAFTMLKWHDPQLSWNTTEYDDIKQITMGTDLIWTPDIVLYNTADIESYAHTDYYKTKAFVSHDGGVIWTNPVTWKASCPFDVTWFPVDRQVCKLTFGSWTYTKSQLMLEEWGAHSQEVQHDHFTIKNGEWDILKMTIIKENLKFPCCPEAYSTMSKEFVLKRRSLYYFLYILLPLIALAFIFPMVFFIPHDSGERMGFGVTILLSITVYLLVISEALPEKSDDKSMLGICFITEFYLLCGALVLSLVTINLHTKTTKPPYYLVKFQQMYQRLKKCQTKENIEPAPEMVSSDGYLHCAFDVPSGNFKRNLLKRHMYRPKSLNSNTPEDEHSLLQERYNYEWRTLAIFLDRIFFVLILFFLAFIPIIITSSLDTKGLG